MMLDDPCLDWLKQEISTFVERQMGDYLISLRARSAAQDLPKKSKVLRDAVWGNIELSSAEVLLLDAPIIQRLRQIGNLGLASLIFPGATHSRFEHTLGVTHIAGRIAEKVTARFHLCPENLTEKCVPLIRIAALFHDTGHIFCSHAGETYFSGKHYSRSHLLTDCFESLKSQLPVERLALGEVLSALILTSRPIVELIEIASSLEPAFSSSGTIEAEEIATLAAEMILGYSSEPGLQPYATIINGPLDADKCDYLARDALQTGVAVIVDIDRLMDKLVPIELPTKASGSTLPKRVLGIKPSALPNVEELTISRRLMYEKVYYHQKVQTAETMFLEALRQIEKGAPDFFSSFDHILRLTDHDLIHLEAQQNLWDWAKRLCVSVIDETAFTTAGKLLEAIARRQLYYRMVELSPSSSHDPLSPEKICRHWANNELEAMKPYLPEMLSHLEGMILVTPKRNISQLVPDIWIDDTYGPRPYRERVDPNLPRKQEASHWVIAPRELAAPTVLVIEVILWRALSLQLGNRQWHHLKANIEWVRALHHYLIAKGYYDAIPGILPIPSLFKARLGDLASYLHLPTTSISSPVNKLSAFLRQFDRFDVDSDRMTRIASLMDLLKFTVVVDKAARDRAFEKAYDALPLRAQAARQPLFRLSQRSALPFSALKRLPELVPLTELSDYLAHQPDHLMILEDAFLSTDDLIDRLKRMLSFEFTENLSSSQQDRLHQIPIYIIASYRLVDKTIKEKLLTIGKHFHLFIGEEVESDLLNGLAAEQISLLQPLLSHVLQTLGEPPRKHSRVQALLIDGIFSTDSLPLLWKNVFNKDQLIWKALWIRDDPK